MILLTYDNGKTWYPCLYDLDSTWGTWTDGTLNESYKILPEDDIADHSTNNLFLRMIKCMPNEISNRWFELRQNIFSKENILKEFKDFFEEIPLQSFEKENNRWKEIPGFGIEQIEEFLNIRLDYIDSIMKKRQTIDVDILKGYIQQLASLWFNNIEIIKIILI